MTEEQTQMDMDASGDAPVEEVETQPVVDGKGRGHYLDPAATTMTGTLPCGYIDLDSGDLYTSFVVREISGREEDLLVGKGAPLQRFNQVIANCLVSIGPITSRSRMREVVLDLPEADREAILITLRRASLGDIFDMRVVCPNPKCKEQMDKKLDLGSLELIKMENPKERHLETDLPSGRVVSWHVMTGHDGEWMEAQDKKSREERPLTLSALARIDSINGVKLDREKGFRKAMDMIGALPSRDRDEFRWVVEEHEGDIDTDIELDCPYCRHEWWGTLPIGSMDFFFRSARRSRLKRRSST